MATIHKGRESFLNSIFITKYAQEYFIRHKMRGAAERIISDKARIARILNGLKNDPLYPSLSCQFVCERIFNIDVVYAEKIQTRVL